MKMDDGLYKDGIQKIISMLIGAAAAAVVTAIMLGIFAFVLLKTDMSANAEGIGLICISVFSCFAGGFFCGKRNDKKGFLWGLAVGVIYFFLLFILRMTGGRELAGQGVHFFTTFLYCAGSGMLGGMLS